MAAASNLASLRAMGRTVVTTRDAAVRLDVTDSAASHLLRRLADAGVIRPLRRGLWAIDPAVDPMQIAAQVTAPYPSYVSLWSALHAHGMLSQVPRETHVVSLGRPGRVDTSAGILELHQVAPEVFGGFVLRADGIALATPAKAVFDLAYLSATYGRRFRDLPEITLGRSYRGADARAWVSKIRTSRVRTITLARLAKIEGNAAAVAGTGYGTVRPDGVLTSPFGSSGP